MKAYIFCIIIAGIFAYFSQKQFNKGKSKIGKLLLALSFIIPCLVAGSRTMLVGRDVTIYITETISMANAQSNIIDFLSVINVEYGFGILIYISNIFKNINVTLFFIELVIMIPIYIYILRNRKDKSVAFMVLVFFLTIFCTSLNIMRQFMAISFIILANDYLKTSEIKKCVLCFLLAISFHSSALIAIFILGVTYIMHRGKNRIVWISVITFCILSIVVLMKPMLSILPSYSYFLNREVTQDVLSIVLSIIKKVFWLFLIIVGYSNKIKDNYKEAMVVAFVLIVYDIAFYTTSLYVSAVGRIGYYFLYVAYFEFLPIISKRFLQKKTVNIIIIAILCLLWYKMTIDDVESWVYPYKSKIITILDESDKII